MNLPPLPPQYMAYRLDWDVEKEKWQKVPCDVTGRNADPTNPANFRPADEVLQHCTWDHTQSGRPYGLAFCLTERDNWFFVDIDDGVDDSGQWKADAAQHFEAFPGAWGEVSVSGTGLHIVGLCQPGQLTAKRNKFYGNKREFYVKDRFIAFGPGGWQRIGGVDQDYDHTATLTNWVPDRPPEEVWDGTVDERYTGPADDGALIDLMLKSMPSAASAFGQKVTIQQLWEGKEEVLCRFFPDVSGRPGKMDRSSADLALMNRLAFWTGKDRARMERLFRLSGLMRDKFDKRADYRTSTVNDAANKCEKVYDYVRPDQRPSNGSVTVGQASGRIMDLATQMEHFAGCYYIANLHKVLLPDGRRLKPEQFNVIYGGHKFVMDLEGQNTTKKAFEAFAENRGVTFPKHTGICFHPDKPFGWIDQWDNVNTYRAPRREARPGDVSPMFELMRALFPTEDDMAIFVAWCARSVQNPEKVPNWSPVLQGCEGCGKTLMANMLGWAMGEEYLHEPKAERFTEKYNGFLVGNVLAVINEVSMTERLDMLNMVKPMITERRQEIRMMAAEPFMADTYIRFLFTTNHTDAVIKTKNDRRFSVFFLRAQSADQLPQLGLTPEFFLRFIDWRDNGGHEAWTHYLMTCEVDPRFDYAGAATRAPDTSTTAAAIAESRGPVAQLLFEAVDGGLPGFKGGYVSVARLSEYLRSKGKGGVAPKTLAKIMRDCGYQSLGKCSIAIMEEGNVRPTVYVNDKSLLNTSPTDYMTAQNYSVVEAKGSWR